MQRIELEDSRPPLGGLPFITQYFLFSYALKELYVKAPHASPHWWDVTSARFQVYEARLFPISLFVFISTQNVYSFCTSCASTWVTVSSTWDASTCDSDINDHKTGFMYYYVLLLLPWLLCEICILSLAILPSFWFVCPFKKKKNVFQKGGIPGKCSDFRNVSRNVYIICPKHQFY